MGFGLKQRVIAYKTAESWENVPHVTFIYTPRIAGIWGGKGGFGGQKGGFGAGNVSEMGVKSAEIGSKSAEKRVKSADFWVENGGKSDPKVTFNSVILHCIADALCAAPKLNAHFHFNRGRVTGRLCPKSEIDVSMPWRLPDGEMVTVKIGDVGGRTPEEIQAAVNRMRARIENTDIEVPLFHVCVRNLLRELRRGHFIRVVRAAIGARRPSRKARKAYRAMPDEDKVLARDLDIGTVTVSNMGSLYKGLRGYVGLLEVIPPTVAAFGIGAIQADGTLPICIAFDHRAVNFGDVVPFIKRFDEICGLALDAMGGV